MPYLFSFPFLFVMSSILPSLTWFSWWILILCRDEKNIQVIIQGPPQQPNMIKAVDIKSREMTLSWSQPLESSNSPLLSFIVDYTLANGKKTKKDKEWGLSFAKTSSYCCLSFLDHFFRNLESRTRIYFCVCHRQLCDSVRFDAWHSVQSTSLCNKFSWKE